MAEHNPHAAPHVAPDDPPTMHDIDKPITIVGVWLVVVVLALANIGLSWMGLGRLGLPVQLAIGTTQAFLVAFYWMHLRRGDKVVTLTALSALFFMAIMFILTLPDYFTRLKMPQWISVPGLAN